MTDYSDIELRELGFSPKKYIELENYLRQQVDDKQLPGVVLGVIRPDQTPFYFCYGFQSREQQIPIAPDSVFRIASMTKPVTALAMLILRHRGLCRFDEPVAKYLPEIAGIKVFDSDTRDGSMARNPDDIMTIRHLLTHTSGLGYDFNVPLAIKRYYDRAAHMPEVNSMQDLCSWLCRLPLAFSPGKGWQYGHSTDLLGCLIEAISGQSLQQFFTDNIFDPLSMVDSGFTLKQNQRQRLCSAYQYKNRQYDLLESADQCSAYEDVSVYMGGAGLLSTPVDYAAFVKMLLNYGDDFLVDGKPLVNDSDIEELSKNCLDPAYTPYNIGAGIPYDTEGYGFAYQVKTLVNPNVKDYRVSQGEYGWSGSYNTHFWIDPGKEIGAILMTQFMPFAAIPLEQEFKKLFYDALVL